MKRLLACALLVACGGGSDPLSVDASGGTTGNYCTYTLTGAINGNYQCKVLVSGSSNAPSSTNVVVNAYNNGAPVAGVVSQWKLHDGLSLSTGTFTQSDVPEANSIVTTGTNVWDMSRGATDQQNHPDVGAATLQISNAGTQIVLGDATVWQHVKGHAELTLPADGPTGATGEVKVTIDFTDSEGIPGTGTNPDGGLPTDGGFVPDGGFTPDGGFSPDGGVGPDGGGGGGNQCVMTFSDGFTATVSCVAHGTYSSSSMLATLNINQASGAAASGADGARFKEASASLTRSGASAFTTGTFDGSGGAQDFADMKTTDGITYMNFGATGGVFTITDTGPSMQLGSQTVYASPHGSYLGTITASGKPDVQFSITF